MKNLFFIGAALCMITCKQQSAKSELPVDISVSDTILAKEKAIVIDSSKIKQLSKYFHFKKDEFDKEDLTWVIPKSAPKFVNRNGLYCCFTLKNNKPVQFVFSVQYLADDWLFIRNCDLLIDGKKFHLEPSEVKRDNGDGEIWEWFSERIFLTNHDFVDALASASKAKIKLNGDKYYESKEISKSQILNIKRTLELYKAMGGDFTYSEI